MSFSREKRQISILFRRSHPMNRFSLRAGQINLRGTCINHDDGSDLPRGLLATDPAKLVAAACAAGSLSDGACA